MNWSRLASLLLCAFALLKAPAPAAAHLRLASSTPAQSDTVRQPLSEIRLTFTQAVPARYTVVTLLDAFGKEVTIGTLTPVGDVLSEEFVLTLAHPLMSGAFTVRWKTAGDDGHVVSGLFDFVVDAVQADGALTPAQAAAPPPAAHDHAMAAEVPPIYRPESSLAWIGARWLNFMAILLLVGAVAFRFAVLEKARKQLDLGSADDIDSSVRRVATVAAVAALVSNGLRLWLQSGSLHGPEQMWQSDMLSAMIFKTGWGKAWLAQTVAAVGFLIAVLIKSRDRLESWYSAAAFAFIVASAPAFSGHAAAVQQMAIVPILDDVVHVITASAWLGTLGVLLLTVVPRALRSESGFVTTSTFVRTFSPFALLMGALTVFTGALNAFVHIGAFSELWTTPYGRILALKIGLVIIALTMGGYNWRVVKPRLGSDSATAHFKRTATSEFLVAVVIIVITAVLVGTPTD